MCDVNIGLQVNHSILLNKLSQTFFETFFSGKCTIIAIIIRPVH